MPRSLQQYLIDENEDEYIPLRPMSEDNDGSPAPPVLDAVDNVRMLDSRQPVSDGDSGAPLARRIQRSQNKLLATVVKR
ncbi:hypothetical protein PTT_07175 [Pyrenophora teres f. teres 0-1]|uniref:Uncharacterized protein n=1 Tax=Pyrenophora teres f. teres (strain 0-1) TaxID=861557 RepID=E3RH26_PYRTT|nr:hypothetical protein PTT_07175 [Pyrenophora teres f. teres 0-1]